MKGFKLVFVLVLVAVGLLAGIFAAISHELAGTAAYLARPAATDSEPATSQAADQHAPEVSGPDNFKALCGRPGVIKCVSFDRKSDLAGTYGDNSGIMPGDSIP